jgi:hypothetical protein
MLYQFDIVPSMKALTLIALITLSGCATCREHPIACTVGVAIIAGSIAATYQPDHRVPQMCAYNAFRGGTARCQ